MRDVIRHRTFYIMLLITEGEGISRTAHEKIMVLKGNGHNLPWLNARIEELIKLAQDQDEKGIKSKLKEIVPEYQPWESEDGTHETAMPEKESIGLSTFSSTAE